MIILVLAVVLLPFSSFLYETDNEDRLVRLYCKLQIIRILTALFYELIYLLIVSLILFISWGFLR
jgi:hypothetical protein